MNELFETNQIYLRFAEPEDSKDLFIWRNDEETRKASFNTKTIEFKEHSNWFKKSLTNPKRNIFIIIDEAFNKLGQIRFDKKNGAAEVDITINPNYRNRGIGSLAILKSSRIFIDNFNISILIAKIKNDNIKSLRAFEKAGYKLHKKNEDSSELWYEK